ncbi:MAG: hypothetical protein EDR02_12065 [Actinobacteria bacterium]|nr:MAG: hypothetical protein EDR02_12065 [Actinomycetota bacterium]
MPILAVLLSLATLACLAGVLIVATGPRAHATVTPLAGFRGSVDGYEGWFGSYHLGDLGPAWCIDHGIAGPDPAFGYLPSSPTEVSAEVRAAMSWIVARWSRPDDAVTSAAMVLALHDLMDARYPSGPLEVFALTPADLEGFGGNGARVIASARILELDGLAHRHLRGPFQLSARAIGVPAGFPGTLVVTATDANGAPIRGAVLAVRTHGARLTSPAAARSDSTGAARFTFSAGAGLNGFEAALITAAPEPAVFAPTRQRAQRVIRPAFASATTATGFDNTEQPAPSSTTVPPTTATTAPASTTVPPTTATTAPASTTTAAPATTSTAVAASTTVAPTSTVTPTTVAPATTAPATPEGTPSTTTVARSGATPPSAPSVTTTPPDAAALAHTGSAADGLAAIGTGVTVLGVALVAARRRLLATRLSR